MRTVICKSYTFSASHRLPLHPGKCKNWHGHNYRYEVELMGTPDPTTGMITDFDDMDEVVEDRILSHLDHAGHLNDHPAFADVPPTAENIAGHIFNTLSTAFRATVSRIRVYETDKCYAEVQI